MRPADLIRRIAGRLRAGQTAKADRVLVHYGILKTGSSSIQETLFRSRTGLGPVLYPDLGMANGSYHLANAFADPRSLIDRRLAPDVAQAHEARARSRRLVSAQLDLRAPGQMAILSGEVISWFSKAEIAELVAYLQDRHLAPQFLGYVREPVSYLKSVFQETLKTELPRKNILMRDLSRAFFRRSFHDVVNRLDAIAGRENVAAFAFDRASFPGGDVVRHFLACAGLNDRAIPIVRVNEGLSLLAVKLLYIYRRFGTPHDSAVASPLSRDAFVAALARSGTREFQLAPELSRLIVAANAPMFDWSARRLDRPLQPPAEAADGGIRFEDELAVLDPAEVELLADLARRHGVAMPARDASPAAVADVVHQIRLVFARAPLS